jgi:hypothetical protein
MARRGKRPRKGMSQQSEQWKLASDNARGDGPARQCFNESGVPKHSWLSRSDARRWMKSKGWRHLNAYRCSRCGFVHVGHKLKTDGDATDDT